MKYLHTSSLRGKNIKASKWQFLCTINHSLGKKIDIQMEIYRRMCLGPNRDLLAPWGTQGREHFSLGEDWWEDKRFVLMTWNSASWEGRGTHSQKRHQHKQRHIVNLWNSRKLRVARVGWDWRWVSAETQKSRSARHRLWFFLTLFITSWVHPAPSIPMPGCHHLQPGHLQWPSLHLELNVLAPLSALISSPFSIRSQSNPFRTLT